MHTVIHSNIYKVGEYGMHLKNLSTEDKISRFGYLIRDDAIDKLVLSMVYNHKDHELWYVMIDDKRVGWGHMAKGEDDSWEMAISVDKDYQGNGIADSLITTIIAWAKFHQIEKFYMHCIENNRVVQHLAAKHGLVTVSKSSGERTALLEVPQPSLLEATGQLWRESTQILNDLSRLQRRLKYLWTLPILPK